MVAPALWETSGIDTAGLKAEMDGTETAPAGRPRRAWSVRARVLALNLAVILVGLVVVGTVTFAVQLSQLNQRIEEELTQEVHELSQVAFAKEDADPAYSDLDDLFYSYLNHSLPGQHESMATLVGDLDAPVPFDGFLYVPGGTLPFRLDRDEVLQLVADHYIDGKATFTSTTLDGKDLRLVISSVNLDRDGGGERGVLVVGIDVGAQREEILESMRVYGLVALGITGLAGVTGHAAAGRLLRPLSELRAATSSISAVDLTRRVDLPDADPDIAELAVTFNQMLDRLEKGFADQRQFLDDAAHELRTPLTIIRGNLELMTLDDPEDVRSTRDLVLDEMDRMQRLVDDLLLLAKSERPDFLRLEYVDISSLADEIKDRVHLIGDRQWRSSEEDLSGKVLADRQRILQAVVQLAANAVKFTEVGDRINVTVTLQSATSSVVHLVPGDVASRYLVISVEDTGTGIEPDQLDRIFDRFGRADTAHHVEGSGLGLAIVAAIARAHQGAVTVQSTVGVGSAFRLWLPADQV